MSACFSEDMLLSFSEQKLPPGEAAQVSAHIDGCSDCRIILSELVHAQTAGPEPEPDRPLVRGSALGRYLVLEQIGAGGMGVVYAAYDADLDRRVALKLLRRVGGAKQRARLVREARSMARLSHPNVAQVFGVETLGERVFVVMEFIVGENARRWAEQERPVAEVLDVFIQAGRGLEAAHHAGIVHRDFKPDNMMVRPNGRVSVLDFGLARPAGEGAPAMPVPDATPTSLTETGTVMGTLQYMPPEQRQGLPTDARADQFAFCVSLHEVLFGADPGEAPKRTPRLGSIVTRALERGRSQQAGDRFPDMHALLSELERARAPARRWGWAAASVALLGAVAAAGVFTQRGPGPCSASERERDRVWNPGQRAAVERALAASGASPGAVLSALDRYGADWVLAHRQACEATRVHGVQSEDLLDRRMLCLDARRAGLGATASALAVGGPSLSRAPIAVAQLPLIDDCADLRWLLAAVPPPADPAVREKLNGVRDQLAKVRAITELGRLDEGVPLAAATVSAAEEVGYAPLLAEALVAQVELLRNSLDTAAVEVAAWHGVRAALQSRDVRLQAEAWLLLADVVGNVMRRPAEGRNLFDVAKTAIAALEVPGLLDARWLRSYGKLLETIGDSAGAVSAYRASIERFASDPRAPRGVETWLWRRIAMNHRYAQQNDLAEVAARNAVAAAEADPTGASHLETALPVLADVLRTQQKYDEARATLKRSLELARKSGNSRNVAINLMGLGELERDAGNLAESEQWFLQQMAGVDQSPQPNPYLAQALGLLGGVQLKRGDVGTAVRTLSKSVAMFDRFGLQRDYETLVFRLTLAEAELAAGDRASAAARLDQVVAVMAETTADAKVLAPRRFHAARLLWQLEGKRPAALRLAAAAREGSTGEAQAAVDAWLSQHPVGR